MRKIVQFEVAVSVAAFEKRLLMYALCDDGTVWWRDPWNNSKQWEKIDNEIPQD